jgi:transcriptional regulator with XRE-family HTH domain
MIRRYAAINEASRRHGERIRKTRRGLGMTQPELAKLFGVWRETISRIECGHFDITRAYPRYQILNERMRIWAEMNKGGRKKKYCGGKKLRQESEPEVVKPRISARSRYWNSYNQMRKEKGKAKNEREDTKRSTKRKRD